MTQIRNETGKDFSLDKVEGRVILTRTIEILPFSTKWIQGITKVKGHDKKVNLNPIVDSLWQNMLVEQRQAFMLYWAFHQVWGQPSIIALMWVATTLS